MEKAVPYLPFVQEEDSWHLILVPFDLSENVAVKEGREEHAEPDFESEDLP